MRLDPLSKSTYSNWLLCPWVAHAHKNLKLPNISGPEAKRGSETHQLIQDVLEGKVDFQDIPKKTQDEEIASWVQRAFSFYLPHTSDLLVEKHVMINKDGALVEKESDAMIHGYLDVLWLEDKNVARFIDWKTSRWERWNDFENFLYALGVKATFPQVKNVIAELCFLRTGNTIRTEYNWQDNDSFCVIKMNNGKEDILWSERNPLLDYFQVRIDKIHATNPIPTPGKHCMKWYGHACQFLAQGCPLTPKNLITQATAALEDPKKYTQALRNILKGKPLNSEIASAGLYAIQQQKQLLTATEETIQDWSRKNGPVQIGNSKFGWKKGESSKVDVLFVIKTLIEQEIPIEDWPRLISVNKTAIKNLPQKQYGELKELLEALAIKTIPGKESFGTIK